MKRYNGDKRYVKTSDIQVGDSVLVTKEQPNKAIPPYEDDKLPVVHTKSSQIVNKRVSAALSPEPLHTLNQFHTTP